MTICRLAAIAAVATLCSSIAPVVGWGQAGNGRSDEHVPPGRVRVTVALVEVLPDTTVGAVIVRRATGSSKGDLILMTRNSASARQLSAAMATLQMTWELDGQIPTRDATVRVTARRGPAAWHDTEERRAESVVRRLRREKPAYVQSLGVVQSVEMRVKPIKLTRRSP